MIGFTTALFAILSLVDSTSSQYLPAEDCPILGPSFPKSFNPSLAKVFRKLPSKFPGLIESAFTSGAVNRTHTSFSIDIFSTVNNQSLYSYHHAAPALNGSLTKGVQSDETVYRIGSVSKLFTVYAILAYTGGIQVFDEPVTRYLPELTGNMGANPVEKIIWEDITVGALASQMGGTGGFRKSVLMI